MDFFGLKYCFDDSLYFSLVLSVVEYFYTKHVDALYILYTLYKLYKYHTIMVVNGKWAR